MDNSVEVTATERPMVCSRIEGEKTMKLSELMFRVRSVRQYTDDPITDGQLEQILQAGLVSMSGRNRKPWELVVVRDREVLQKMSRCRMKGSAKMLEGAACAIVVLGLPENSDTWVEDCAIVMTNMHLMAESLGLGSCWIQGRGREAETGGSTEDYLRSLLHFPENYSLAAVLSLGIPASHPAEHTVEELPRKVHYENW